LAIASQGVKSAGEAAMNEPEDRFDGAGARDGR
jgi:hypothetical protein